MAKRIKIQNKINDLCWFANRVFVVGWLDQDSNSEISWRPYADPEPWFLGITYRDYCFEDVVLKASYLSVPYYNPPLLILWRVWLKYLLILLYKCMLRWCETSHHVLVKGWELYDHPVLAPNFTSSPLCYLALIAEHSDNFNPPFAIKHHRTWRKYKLNTLFTNPSSCTEKLWWLA